MCIAPGGQEISGCRGARSVETAEEARVMAVKQKAEEDAQSAMIAEKRAALDARRRLVLMPRRK